MFGMDRMGLFFDKDGSAGGGTDDGAGKDADKDVKDTTKSADGKAGEDAAGKDADEKKFTQAELETIIDDRLKRERKKADDSAEKAKKKADEDALKANQEFQKLAEQRQTRIEELERSVNELNVIKEQAERYKTALDKQLKAMIEKLPKHILPLLEKMDPIEAMDYIGKHAKELGASFETYGRTPEGKEKTLSDDEKDEGKKQVASVIKRNF